MCFSATASFAASGILLTIGTGTAIRSLQLKNRAFYAVPVVPISFGLQQASEGMVWLNVASGNSASAHTFSLSYLFFAYCFWTFWMPILAYFYERDSHKKKVLKVFIFVGAFYGTLIYLPLLLHRDWVRPEVDHNSLAYNAVAYFISFVPLEMYAILFILIAVGALVYSSNFHIRTFGFLVFAAVIVTDIFYKLTFTSVWCFSASLLSIYLAFSLNRDPQTSTLDKNAIESTFDRRSSDRC